MRAKPKYLERKKILSQMYFTHHKSHAEWPASNPGVRGYRTETNSLTYYTAIICVINLYNTQYLIS